MLAGAFGVADAVSQSRADSASESRRSQTWLRIHFTHRTRYETLANRFRIGESGGDQQLPLRTRLRVDVEGLSVPFEFSVELQDSRAYLNDEDSLLTSSHVNEMDILQANVSFASDRFFGLSSSMRLRGGRFTLDLGSRRFVARHRFRNTANAFDGVYWSLDDVERWNVQAFLTVPVVIDPTELDTSDTAQWFWGAIGQRLWEVSRLGLDVFYYRLASDDMAPVARDVATLGGRVFRSPGEEGLDFELEAAWQTGDLGESSRNGFFQHAEVGYSFPGAWRTRMVLQHDYASGDEEPFDGERNDFFTLLGVHRFDFGPTGIYGPFRRSNIHTPGVRLFLGPRPTLDVMAAQRFYWLAEAKDAWRGSGLRDPTGASGRYLGHQFETRVRWRPIRTLSLETGFAYFGKGSFVADVPGSPGDDPSSYLYVAASLAVSIWPFDRD